MTSLWRTCFSAFFAATLSGATVSGTIELHDSSDPAVRKKSDYSGVVVWLEPARPVARPPVGGQHAKLVQKDKTFTPHVLAVPVGTTVDFPNLDPIFHNAFSNYDGKVFDVGLYPPGSSRSVRFDRPGFVRVFCNIHASMSAIIAVVDSPWLAVTGGNGKFTIADVPPGDYVFRIFHERAAASALNALSRRVTVGGEPVALVPVSISESGYLAIPHKNKYGHEYPPAMEGGAGYPAVRP